jgi:predicted MFS family arabinose efflux permease
MRAFWTRCFAAEPATRAVASSLESIIVDLSFVSGPGLVSIVVLAGPAPLALLVVGALRATTGVALTWLPSFRAMVTATEAAGTARRDRRSPWRNGALLGLLPVALLAFGSISAIEVGVSSLAQSHGHRAAAGVLIAILSVGGILGGLLRGHLARRDARPTPGQLVAALAILTLAWAAPIAVPALVPLAVVLLLAGIVMNPMISLHYDLLGDRVSGAHRTEAFGWMTSANAVGAALGAGVAGVLSAAGPSGGFAVASAMTAMAALIAVLTARLLGAPLPD